MKFLPSVDDLRNTSWEMEITPERKWWDFHLKELWFYRDLIFILVKRDFIAQYKQTILGPLWYLLSPLLSTAAFTIIFSRLANLPTDEIPPFLFYLSGNVIWSYFASSLTGTSNTFVANQHLFDKVYFPRIIIPISVVISGLIGFFIRFLLFSGFLLFFLLSGASVQPSWWILATPLLLLLQAGLGLGWGIIISSLTTKYRDLQVLVSFGVTLLMYATPVIYPASMVPAQFRAIYFLNPIAPVVEAFRFIYLGQGTVDLIKLGYSAVVMIVSLIIGIGLFNKIEATFMDTV